MRVLSFGAGVQSTALLHMIIEGAIDSVDLIVFADTGWEPENVYSHVEQCRIIAEEHGIEWTTVCNDLGQAELSAVAGDTNGVHVPYFTRFSGKSGMIRRTCTRLFKIEPIRREIKKRMGLLKGQRVKENVEMVIGISSDEKQRMTQPVEKWLRHVYPLVDLRMTRLQCLDWMRDRGIEVPSKSACVFCPYKKRADWHDMKITDPESWRKAVAFDNAMRNRTNDDSQLFLLSSLEPLESAKLITSTREAQSELGFVDECDGMCGM